MLIVRENMLQASVRLGDQKTYGESPLISADTELVQASMAANSKYSINYFMRLNKVRTDDNRYSPLNVFTENIFFDLRNLPLFWSQSYEQHGNVTFDGTTYNKVEFLVLFRS